MRTWSSNISSGLLSSLILAVLYRFVSSRLRVCVCRALERHAAEHLLRAPPGLDCQASAGVQDRTRPHERKQVPRNPPSRRLFSFLSLAWVLSCFFPVLLKN